MPARRQAQSVARVEIGAIHERWPEDSFTPFFGRALPGRHADIVHFNSNYTACLFADDNFKAAVKEDAPGTFNVTYVMQEEFSEEATLWAGTVRITKDKNRVNQSGRVNIQGEPVSSLLGGKRILRWRVSDRDRLGARALHLVFETPVDGEYLGGYVPALARAEAMATLAQARTQAAATIAQAQQQGRQQAADALAQAQQQATAFLAQAQQQQAAQVAAQVAAGVAAGLAQARAAAAAAAQAEAEAAIVHVAVNVRRGGGEEEAEEAEEAEAEDDDAGL